MNLAIEVPGWWRGLIVAAVGGGLLVVIAGWPRVDPDVRPGVEGAALPSSLSIESRVYGRAYPPVGAMDWESLLAVATDEDEILAKRLAALREMRARDTFRSRRVAGLMWPGLDGAGIESMAAIYRIEDREWFDGFLVLLLTTGSDADAERAIRAMAVLGGSDHTGRLADILNDDAWPDRLRKEAARALWRIGGDTAVTMVIRGLATLGGKDGVNELGAIVGDPTIPSAWRLEAARALGRIGGDAAAEFLLDAFARARDKEEKAALMACLGELPFGGRLAEFWQGVIQSPDPAMRSAGAEALSGAGPGAIPLLGGLLAGDPSPEVREMSAWAISAQDPGGRMAGELRDLVAAEPEADVRRRIYEAMLVQETPIEAAAASAAIERETDPDARVAAINAVADSVGRGGDAALAVDFDRDTVPELVRTAESGASPNLRMRAVFALRRASTPAALDALRKLSGNPTPVIATAALNGLNNKSQP